MECRKKRMEFRLRRPPKRLPAVASTKDCKFPASRARQESSPSFPECPLLPVEIQHLRRKIQSLQFNPDLILLKPPRNAKAVTYSHWGGTDHEELRDPHQRRGSGLQFFGKATAEASRLPHTLSPALPSPVFCPEEISAEITCHERLLSRSLVVRRRSLAGTASSARRAKDSQESLA